MDPPRYDITKQTINLARIALIFFGPCTDILRDILKAYINPPESLPQLVKAFFQNYPHLNNIISRTQKGIIYSNDYNKFDISLLYFLLRNICTIKEHEGRWGFEPPPRRQKFSGMDREDTPKKKHLPWAFCRFLYFRQ